MLALKLATGYLQTLRQRKEAREVKGQELPGLFRTALFE
jgi:hypothetical protein